MENQVINFGEFMDAHVEELFESTGAMTWAEFRSDYLHLPDEVETLWDAGLAAALVTMQFLTFAAMYNKSLSRKLNELFPCESNTYRFFVTEYERQFVYDALEPSTKKNIFDMIDAGVDRHTISIEMGIPAFIISMAAHEKEDK